MKIALLKENENEKRVVMIPETVKKLIALKVNVAIEIGAGEKSFISDKNFEEAGAKIINKKEELIKDADIIIKINPPTEEERKLIGTDKILISVLNPLINNDLVKDIAEKQITSFSMDMIPRTTRGQSMDILSSQATVAGYKAVLLAANEIPNFFPMFMTASGTIKPARVLIIGAGVAGLQAIAITRKLGAIVEVSDVRAAVKEQVQSLGGKFLEVEGAKDDKDAGGYAVEQDDEFKKKQQELLHKTAVKANVIICTAQIPGRTAPVIIKKETVEQMKAGSVIIDLAASTGGNCELTKNNETIINKGVKIIGNSNLAAEIPQDASKMFGINIYNFLELLIDKEGKLKLDLEDDIIKGTCITHKGEIIINC